MIQKIISGGQTGADRAGLDGAIESGIAHGGWIPKGRKAEDGVIPAKYNLMEMASAQYAKRTQQNVIDSDGTVIFSYGSLTQGSLLTHRVAQHYNKPCLHIDLNIDTNSVSVLKEWLAVWDISILNVAGQRASQAPMIYKQVKHIIKAVIT